MRITLRNDREVLNRLRQQRRYRPRKQVQKVNNAITALVQKAKKGARVSSEFFGLGESVEDKYYVRSHFVPRDVSSEFGDWAGIKKRYLLVVVALIGVLLLLRK